MEYLLQFAHALVSPINCVGNLGGDVVMAVGNFAQCIGHNLSGAAQTSATVITSATTAVTSIGA